MTGLGESLRESRTAVSEVFSNRDLRRVNLAFAGSIVGDWAYNVAAGVYAYHHGGPTVLGLVAVIRFTVVAICAPFTSSLADRFPRRRVMLCADLFRVCTVTFAAMVIWQGWSPVIVYSVSVLSGIAGTAFRPAQAALLPTLARHPGELTAANVTSSTIESVGFFAGPAIAGFLLAIASIPVVYLVNACSFAWSAMLVFGLPAAAPVAPAEPVEGTEQESSTESTGTDDGIEPVESSRWHETTAGFREIAHNPDLRLLIGLYCVQTVVAGASVVYDVAIALDLLHTGNSGVGYLGTSLGVGGLIGGLVALIMAQRHRLAFDFGIGVMLWAAPLLLVAAFPHVAVAMLALALIGLGNSIVDVNAITILQRLVPDRIMGRVFGALESAVIGGMAVGSLVMPLLIRTVGLRTGLVILGTTVTAVVVLGMRGLSRIDHHTLAPEGLALLSAVPMLGVLPSRVRERLARQSTVVEFAAGEVVFREGDEGDRYYVIEDGTVDVTIRGDFVRTLGPGGAFGEIALLRDLPRTATITATSALRLRALDREPFLAAVTGHSASADAADHTVTSLMVVR